MKTRIKIITYADGRIEYVCQQKQDFFNALKDAFFAKDSSLAWVLLVISRGILLPFFVYFLLRWDELDNGKFDSIHQAEFAIRVFLIEKSNKNHELMVEKKAKKIKSINYQKYP